MVRFKEGDTLGLINILALLLHKISITKKMFQKCISQTLHLRQQTFLILYLVWWEALEDKDSLLAVK